MSGATELVISGNSPTLNVNPVNIRFPNTMTGTGALTIPGIRGQSLDVATGLRLPANMRGYRGHMIIGGDTCLQQAGHARGHDTVLFPVRAQYQGQRAAPDRQPAHTDRRPP